MWVNIVLVVIPVVIFYYIIPFIKIVIGQLYITQQLNKLDKKQYRILKNISMTYAGNNFKFDYIIASIHGIFIINKLKFLRAFSTLSGDDLSNTWRLLIHPRVGPYPRAENYKVPGLNTFGDDHYDAQDFTQDSRAKYFNNPIPTLKAGLRELDRSINTPDKNIPIHAFIVIIPKLKFLQVTSKTASILYSSELLKKIYQYSKEILSSNQLDEVCDQILKMNERTA